MQQVSQQVSQVWYGRLPLDMVAAIERVAAELDRPMSSTLRFLVKESLVRRGELQTNGAARGR